MKVFIPLEVKTPKGMSPRKARELVQQIIEVGQSDAGETADDPELDNRDADKAASLGIKVKQAQTAQPVVIVAMHGGLVESVYINDPRLKGARVVVTERPDEAEDDRPEVYVKGGELDGQLVYAQADVYNPTPETVKAVIGAAIEYENADGE